VLYNNDNTSRTMSVQFNALGADSSVQPAAVVRDLWAHTTLAGKHTNHTASVAPHGVVALHLTV
jgi:hypothetical protein